jgi:hypothetical protein
VQRQLSGFFRARRVVVIALLIFLSGYSATAAQTDLVGKNMVGVRLGPWLADGLTRDLETKNETTSVRVFSSSTAFHLEFFYLYQLKGPLYLDLNFGGVSRGDIRIDYISQTAEEKGFGTAQIYPLSIGLGLFPLATRPDTKMQPFAVAGGSLVIGTETISFAGRNVYVGNYVGIQSESRETIGWYAGGGLDWVMGRNFVLSFLGKYQHAIFSEELVGVKDFSGAQILIGAAYAYK